MPPGRSRGSVHSLGPPAKARHATFGSTRARIAPCSRKPGSARRPAPPGTRRGRQRAGLNGARPALGECGTVTRTRPGLAQRRSLALRACAGSCMRERGSARTFWTKRTDGRCHSGLRRIRSAPKAVFSATTRVAFSAASDGTGCSAGTSLGSVPETHGLEPPSPRVTGREGSSTHLSQHWLPHHAWSHATHTLQPRVLAQSLQHSAGDADTVAPGPDPGTMTAPSYS
eukprot:4180800-Prymnesium_polylepis.1